MIDGRTRGLGHATANVLVAILALGAGADADAREDMNGGGGQRRSFPDRPLARFEYDDLDVSRPPASNNLQDLDTTLILRDDVANEIDRVLALEGKLPAQDVNAADEVPCSTWYCARNHLHPMTPAEVAGPPPGGAPVLPLTIIGAKDQGASPGFQIADARGHKFMLKMDPVGHLGLATGGEMIGNRVFHAAGYNVPGSFLLDLAPVDLRLDPHATFKLFGVEKRPLTAEQVAQQLKGVARLPDGLIRVVAVPWVGGQIVGSVRCV